MDFKKATDELFEGINHSSLAKSLGVSIPTIRQARLAEQTKAHRSPPPDWRRAVIRLAEERVWHYRKLIESLQIDDGDK
jgi:hypothetical protein